MEKKILVTGSAGFIGYHLAIKLLNDNYEVIGIDNINNYYDPNLKINRLKKCGINSIKDGEYVKSDIYDKYHFLKMDILNKVDLSKLFNDNKFDFVIHLAAQAGVRHSIENPQTYIDNNIHGFLNILEELKKQQDVKLIYASSSSVYGNNTKQPFKESDKVDKPISIYALSKKANEMMAYTYSKMYGIKSIGLRFFTVYGPYGRPDMAPFLFADAIKGKKPIKVFNFGKMSRDFTYIDDIIQGIVEILPIHNKIKQSIFNIGANKPVNLEYFISILEKEFNMLAVKQYEPIQSGDVEKTWADTTLLRNVTGYTPTTDIESGVKEFVKWFNLYYK